MKLFSWFAKLLITTIFVSSLSMITTFVLINLYAEQIFKSLNMSDSVPKLSITDMVAHLTGKENRIQDKVSSQHLDPPQQNTEALSGEEGKASDEVVEDATPAWNQSTSNQEKQEMDLEKKVIMTTEDFNKKKELLTNEEKMRVFSIILSSVPQQEIQNISHIMEEGITNQELKDVETTLKSYLKPEEFVELLEILNKY